MNLQELLGLTVSPYMPEALVSNASMQKIEKVAAHFPNQLTSFFGFECRLGEPDPKADFLLSIDVSEYGRDILAGHDAIPAQWVANIAWQKVLRFANSWNNAASDLYDSTDFIWLEFDIAEKPLADIPVPSIFFAPYDQKEKVHLKGEKSTTIIVKSLETIQGKKIQPTIIQQLALVETALPSTAAIFQVGTMLARDVDAYRICISDIAVLEVRPFLQKIGWQGDVAALTENLHTIAPLIDRICLDIDVGTTIGNKIGLECYQAANESVVDNWKPVLHFLETQQLCTSAKKQGLLNYFGNIHAGMVEKDAWTPHLTALASIIGKRYLSMYIRDINHIKLNFNEGHFTEAKAYLSVKHIWANIAVLQKMMANNRLKKELEIV